MLNNMKIALVHDWLNQIGGAENVLEELVDLFPGAPVYTSMYAAEKMPSSYRSWDIHTSFMQRLPGIFDHHQPYMPIYPLAFQRTMLTDYDLVLSNKSGFCHGVITKDVLTSSKFAEHVNGLANSMPLVKRSTTHVCYCLTPTRFLWLYEQYREREQFGNITDMVLRPILSLLRRWDRRAAQQVDHFIAISTEIQKRIKQIYGRDSVVIHPPVDTDYFVPAKDAVAGDYFLSIGRLIPYKRVDLAVGAFAQLPNEKLIVVGDGRDYATLAKQATPNVTFLGRQSRDSIRELLQNCRGFVFPGLEDFGIAPVEALSVGRPVIAFKGGGALDTIEPGITGEYFVDPTVDSLVQTLQNFDATAYNPADCRAQAEKFSADSFRHKLMTYLEQVVDSQNSNGSFASHEVDKAALR